MDIGTPLVRASRRSVLTPEPDLAANPVEDEDTSKTADVTTAPERRPEPTEAAHR